MRKPALLAAVVAVVVAGPAFAETLRSATTFNTGAQKPAEQQPADGVAVIYPVAYAGGDLDGCTAEVAESLYPRDEGAWGIYEVAAEVTCADGGFAFTSAGSWDAKGFHGTGRVTDGSGTGRFEGLAGRIAQSGGFAAAANDTSDISHEIMIDRAAP